MTSCNSDAAKKWQNFSFPREKLSPNVFGIWWVLFLDSNGLDLAFLIIDLIDKFNDTSRYLEDVFIIDKPAFAEHIPDIYPRKPQLNKANTSDTETSFLDLNIKVIGYNIHTSVDDKRDEFEFPIVNFPWLSVDVPKLPSYGIYISQLVRFARCCTSVLNFHSKNLQITSKLLTQVYRFNKLR